MTIAIKELVPMFSEREQLSKKQSRLKKLIDKGGIPTTKHGSGFVVAVSDERFDSVLEFARYLELLALQEAGIIKGLSRQNQYTILLAFTHKFDGKQRPITYKDDFGYIVGDMKVSEDVKASPYAKGIATYNLKVKFLRSVYPNTSFTVVYSSNVEERLNAKT